MLITQRVIKMTTYKGSTVYGQDRVGAMAKLSLKRWLKLHLNSSIVKSYSSQNPNHISRLGVLVKILVS